MVAIVSFVLFTGLVAVLTWWITRNDEIRTSDGFFLAGRSLTFPFIAGSLLLTNLSTEQMVGLNGDAYSFGLCVMVWEVVCVVALVFMAWFFLPRFLRYGVTTVPEYLGLRFDNDTKLIANIILLIAYVVILLPMILYTGAQGMIGIMGVPEFLEGGVPGLLRRPPDALPSFLHISGERLYLWLVVWAVGIGGSIYALFGGMRSIAVSDTLNGIGLLTGGLLLTYFAFQYVGGELGFWEGVRIVTTEQKDRFNSVGGSQTNVPFGAIFSGIFLLNLFYWTTNQQIIQRTFAAKGLAEGQKGVLLTGALKLFGPLYLVLPGMIAWSVFKDQPVEHDLVYGKLVSLVLPPYLTGFFAAVIIGAILSSFNSALNSTCTLFSLGLYNGILRRSPTESQMVRASVRFGWLVAIAAMTLAPFLENQKSIFGYLQKMNGMYFIPIFAVVLLGMLTRRLPPLAAKAGLLVGITVIPVGYFIYPFNQIVASLHDFHFLGIVFCWLIVMMLVIGEWKPMPQEFEHPDSGIVDMTPWRWTRLCGLLLIAAVFLIYATFADFSVLAPYGK